MSKKSVAWCPKSGGLQGTTVWSNGNNVHIRATTSRGERAITVTLVLPPKEIELFMMALKEVIEEMVAK